MTEPTTGQLRSAITAMGWKVSPYSPYRYDRATNTETPGVVWATGHRPGDDPSGPAHLALGYGDNERAALLDATGGIVVITGDAAPFPWWEAMA